MIRRRLLGGGAATPLGDIGWAILRVSVGLFIATHGWQKLQDPSGFLGYPAKMGFPYPTAFGWAAILTEFAGGLLLVLGLLTRFASLALVFNMGVAAFVAKAGLPFVAGNSSADSKELPMMYLFVFLAFLLAGAGRFSLDALLRPKAVVVETRDEVITEPGRRRVV